MATKKTTTTTTTRRTVNGKSWLLRAASYFALVIAAFMFLFGGIFSGAAKSVLELIGKLFMLVGIGIPAYDYTRGKKTAWRVVYWIALAVYVFGCIFGIIKAFWRQKEGKKRDSYGIAAFFLYKDAKKRYNDGIYVVVPCPENDAGV